MVPPWWKILLFSWTSLQLSSFLFILRISPWDRSFESSSYLGCRHSIVPHSSFHQWLSSIYFWHPFCTWLPFFPFSVPSDVLRVDLNLALYCTHSPITFFVNKFFVPPQTVCSDSRDNTKCGLSVFLVFLFSKSPTMLLEKGCCGSLLWLGFKALRKSFLIVWSCKVDSH